EGEAIRLRIPPEVRDFGVASGGKLVALDAARQSAWLLPAFEGGEADVVLRYDFALPKGESPNNSELRVEVPLVWPELATRKVAKVRIWSESRMKPSLAELEIWIDKGIDIVPSSDALPALVVHGSGAHLPLAVNLTLTNQSLLPSAHCARGLVQAVIDED